MNILTAILNRKTLYIILSLILVVAASFAIFIKQLHIEDYRHTLEQEISETLGQPVEIGQISVALNKGLALKLHNLKIGPAESPRLQVPYLTALLKIRPLLSGEILLDQVLIEKPDILIQPSSTLLPGKSSPHSLLDKFGIRILTIRDARLKILRQPRNGPRQAIELKNLHMVLSGWEKGKSGRLVLNGRLPQQGKAAEYTIDISLPTTDSEAGQWRQEQLKGTLKLTGLSRAQLPPPLQKGLPKTIDIRAALDGTPASGARLTATLFPHDGKSPHFALQGVWQSSTEQERLSELSLTLLDVPLHGQLQLNRQEAASELTAELTAGPLALTPQLLARWPIPVAGKLQQGTLDHLKLQLEQNWPDGTPPKAWPDLLAGFRVSHLQWKSPTLKPLERLSADLSLENQTLKIQDGLAGNVSQSLQFSGQIAQLFNGPELDLSARSEMRLEELLNTKSLPEEWTLQGPVPATLKLQGSWPQLQYQLTADLAATRIKLGPLLDKPSGTQAHLSLNGNAESSALQIDRALFQLGAAKVSGQGRLRTTGSGPEANLVLSDLDLGQLQPHSPLLSRLQLVGRIGGQLQKKGKNFQGHVKVNAAGAHLIRILADLKQVHGEVDFDDQGLRFSGLQATLGQSKLNLDGAIPSWENPELRLTVRAPKIRAHDLIFPNRELTLYDLSGKLRITRTDLYFDKVKVRLEKKTQATVTGKIDNFANPQTVLRIDSEQAMLLDVIKLFHGPRPAGQRPTKKHRPLIIDVKAASGTLGGLHFQKAEGHIIDRNGILTIYPLTFQSGPGYCLGRVEVDRSQPEVLLKTSGHVEEMDASVLHEELFLKRGLLSGSLRGDFYVEGHPGERFWETATGGIHMQIKDGTLRKFRGLARVFSLLNVSQLFNFKLPDMDREGMPFSLLEGSLRLDEGILQTKDMKVTSVAMNMSLVGERNLVDETVDMTLGVMPLRTVDKVISKIPIAGWLLAGEDNALLTAHFKIQGPAESPKVSAIPLSSVSETVFGIFKRTFGLPGKILEDVGQILRDDNSAPPPEEAPPAQEP